MIKSFTNCAHALSHSHMPLELLHQILKLANYFDEDMNEMYFLAMRKIIGNKYDFIFNLKHEQ